MNWDAIGAVGEIIGAVAVVGTLAYLATQIRVAGLSAESQGSYASAEVYSRWRNTLINNPEIICAITKANRGEDLSPEGTLQLSTVMDELFVAALVSTTSTEKWATMQTSATDFVYLKGIFAANPGLVPYWKQQRAFCATVSEQFVKTVDELIAELGKENAAPSKNLRLDP